MVRDTLFNDYHNGVLRTHKRERVTINGKDKKIPADEQFVFPGHHPKIFDDDTMKLLLETRESRRQSRYRGQRRHVNLFSGCLYCGDCGFKLTAINRPGRSKYYVCGAYNKKGKQFCGSAHRITETILSEALTKYLAYCRDCLSDTIGGLDLSRLKVNTYTQADSRQRLEKELETVREELKILVSQKIRELKANPSMSEIITETYASLQKEKAERISMLEKTLHNLSEESGTSTASTRECRLHAPDILHEVIDNGQLSRADVEILVEKIIVDKDGNADIYLKHGLGGQMGCGFQSEKDDTRLNILLESLSLLAQDTTGYTSVRFLADSLKNMGYPIHKKKYAPYITYLLELGILEKTDSYHKPYKIVASGQELADMKKELLSQAVSAGCRGTET